MSFRLNSSEQFGFMDRLGMLTDRDKRRLEKSWAKVFADEVFPYIDESKYSVLYSSNPASRPNTPVNVIIGGIIIRELFGYSDEAFVEASSLDIRIAYALHTQGFTEQPFSDRTFSRFRERCFRYEQETGRDLLKETFTELSDHIAKLMNINKQLSRMDSMMINANIKKLSRLELLYRCNENLASAIFKTDEKLL